MYSKQSTVEKMITILLFVFFYHVLGSFILQTLKYRLASNEIKTSIPISYMYIALTSSATETSNLGTVLIYSDPDVFFIFFIHYIVYLLINTP